MFLTLILFFLGFVLLVKGASFLVDGASAIAKKFNISNLVIGLTIASFGTSLPEMVATIMASLRGSDEIAIGTIVGSNISNVFLVLGVSAAIYPLVVQRNTIWKEIPFSVLAALVLGILANDHLIDGQGYTLLTRIDGLVLIAFLVIFLYYVFEVAKKEKDQDLGTVKEMGTGKSIGLIALGIVLLPIGGQWLVDGAIKIASMFGVSESLIGLTVVAIGTSLPELATSAMAAYRKNAGIAIGNVVGSNIFNIFWVLGLSSIIRPLAFQEQNSPDVGMVIVASFLLFIFMFIGKKHTLQRWQGVVFIVMYVLYVGYLVMRG